MRLMCLVSYKIMSVEKTEIAKANACQAAEKLFDFLTVAEIGMKQSDSYWSWKKFGFVNCASESANAAGLKRTAAARRVVTGQQTANIASPSL